MDNFGGGYAFRYAAVYTAIIVAILSSPLYVYYTLTESIYEAKSALELKDQALDIVQRMEEYNPDHEPYFSFPRFATYEAGLFDADNREIFSLITHELGPLETGYHIRGDYRYYVLPLPPGRYFGADKLAVSKIEHRYAVQKQVLTVALSIVVIVYALSWLVLHNFAEPFRKINRMLDEFIKDSMHEIKTPLSIINLSADLFLSKNAENRQMRNIKAAAKTLATVYDDMEYLVREDRVEYPKESLDFSAFLQSRIDYFREIAGLKRIELHTHIEPDIPLYFNPIQLQRVIDNNLSNAVKYSHENSAIHIWLYYRTDAIYLRFKDRGTGIKNPERIFQRYYRESHLKGGFGLGLAIVRRILEREGAGFAVKSRVGTGTIFTYRFNTQIPQ